MNLFDIKRLESKVEAVNSPAIGLFSSGSTGTPKLVWHSISSFFDGINPHHPCKIWGLSYQPFRMAGLQVLAQAISSGAKVIAPENTGHIATAVVEFVVNNVEGLSATPSYWNLALPYFQGGSSSLRYISIGGEPVNQNLLSKLSEKFPGAEIRHIYATTETGTVFSVADKKEGFPMAFFHKVHRGGKRLKLIENELAVSVPTRNAISDEWYLTGDRIKVVQSRAFFDGRNDDMINVGGSKIPLIKIEQEILMLAEVLDCVVYQVKSPFTGSAVAVDIVWKHCLSDEELRRRISAKIPRFAVPVSITAVEHISLSETGKKLRRRSH
jgi:acyl-coenzyme A synthetase/AMP-(fatty) acid ligase